MSTENKFGKYQRQVILKELGESGQQKLFAAKVLVVGAGGLGCPILQYLVAAGVGNIGIVDDDTVAIHNLHRQPLYGPGDVGSSKAVVAAVVLKKQNPDVAIQVFNERLTTENAERIINAFDIIVDGTDNFATRYLINDACILLGKPLVFGAVLQFEGQVAVFDAKNHGASYRDLFPEPPKDDEVPNCADAGVIGVLPGIIGTMMACETVKWIAGIGKPLTGQMLTFNALENRFYSFNITPHPAGRERVPSNLENFRKTDYAWLCAPVVSVPEIAVEEFEKLLNTDNLDIIDVREVGELPEVRTFKHRHRPLKQLAGLEPLHGKDTVVVFCQSGNRSRQAVTQLISTWGNDKKIFSLKGGIQAWVKHQSALRQ